MRLEGALFSSIMSLRAVTLGSLILVISIILLGFGTWSIPFLNDYVKSYELTSARKKVEEARAGVANYPRRGAHVARSWSAWGAQYDFTQPCDVNWERSFTVPSALRAFDVSILVVLDQHARVRSAIYLDNEVQSGPLPASIRGQLAPDLPLLKSLKTARGLFFRQGEQL